MADYIESQAALDMVRGLEERYVNNLPPMIDKVDICNALDTLPSADEWAIVTEYCRKRNLVIITMESFRVLQAYYNRQNGMDGD